MRNITAGPHHHNHDLRPLLYLILQFRQAILGAVGFVIVATQRTDRYGRYLADVRYLPGAAEPQGVQEKGRLLNQELLDRGVVRPYL